MAHQSGSPRFQALFESALEAYEKKAGVTLVEHPLAIQFQSCDSIEDILTILQRQTQAFMNLQGNDRIFKSIKTTISNLTTLSSAASLADAFSLVRQKMLTQCSTSDRFLVTDIPACEGSTSVSRHPTRCMSVP